MIVWRILALSVTKKRCKNEMKKFIKDASIIALGLFTLFWGFVTWAALTPDEEYHHCESGQVEWSAFQCAITFAISLLFFVLSVIPQKINLKKLLLSILWIVLLGVIILAIM